MSATFDNRRREFLKKLVEKTNHEIEVTEKKTEVLVERENGRNSKSGSPLLALYLLSN